MSPSSPQHEPPNPPQPPQGRRPWRSPVVWIGLAISGLSVAVFLHYFEVSRVLSVLVQVDPWAMVAAAAVFLASYRLRGLRWQRLLSPMARLPHGAVHDVLLLGFMGNWLLPARAGELARALLLWKVTGTSWRGALATIAVERLLDACTLIALLTALAWLFDVPPRLRTLGQFTGAVLLATAVGSFWLALHPRSFFALLEGALFFLPARLRRRISTFFRRFVDGFQVLRRPALLLQVVALSPLIWGLELLVYLLVMRGFGLELPAWAAGVALTVTNFSIAVPSGPGALGVFEAGCAGALRALGLAWEPALAYAIAVHLLFFVCIVGTGTILMWRLGLSLSDFTGHRADAPDDGD